MPERRTRSTLGAVALAACLPLSLAACGDDEPGPKPDLPSETPALWNPCDALDARFVRANFGVATTENNGSATEPDCRFAPEADSGDAVITVNYQLFDGDLDELWDTMGQQDSADVRDPSIDGADAARVVVDTRKDQLYVTGFVETGTLFQVINVADPRPYDEESVVAGVEATLTALAAHAKDAGIGGEPGDGASDGASPTS